MAEHTPTPWSAKRGRIYGPFRDKSRGMQDIAGLITTNNDVENTAANAAFIVKACNSHDALVKALTKAKTCLLDDCLPWVRHNGPREGTTHGRIDEVVAFIDAALTTRPSQGE